MEKIIQKVFLSTIIICMLAMPAIADYDVISPVINSVTLDPAEPNTGDDILVTVNATDDVGVTAVTANDEPLSNNGIDDTWEGTITAINGTHTVNISASDATANIVYDETASYTATISRGEAGETGEAGEAGETGEAGGEGVVAESTEIADETNESSGEDNMGIPGFGLLTGLSVMLIAIRFLRED